MQKKIILITIFVLFPAFLFAATPEFNSDNVGGAIGETENPFGPLIAVFQSWITSFAFGSLCTIRFCKDIVTAYLNREHDPDGLKKALIRFFVVAVFAVAGFRLITQGVSSGLLLFFNRLG